MTTSTLFCICLLVVVLLFIAFLLGAYLNYQRGYWDGYSDAECSNHSDADTTAAIKWQRYSRDKEDAKF